MTQDDLQLRNEISKEQDERIFSATKDLMRLAAELGIEEVEVGGIKIKNRLGPSPNPKQDGVFLSEEHAKQLADAGVIEYQDPLDKDPYSDPELFSSADGGTSLNVVA